LRGDFITSSCRASLHEGPEKYDTQQLEAGSRDNGRWHHVFAFPVRQPKPLPLGQAHKKGTRAAGSTASVVDIIVTASVLDIITGAGYESYPVAGIHDS
jgi:hypothetical protein